MSNKHYSALFYVSLFHCEVFKICTKPWLYYFKSVFLKQKDKRSMLHLWCIYVKTPPDVAVARFAAMINKSVEHILIFINNCIKWQGIITHSKFVNSAPDLELLNSGNMSVIPLDIIPLIEVSSIR